MTDTLSTRTFAVLNVEDHAPTRFVRSTILSRAGFDVREAQSAAEARSSLATERPDLLLLDLRLPDGDGFSLCEHVKQRYPGLPVIMVTSVFRTTDARRDGFACGADAFLLEPVDSHLLIRVATGLCRGEALEDATHSWVITDAQGYLVEISPRAATLLNFSRKGQLRRNLLPFFARDRDVIAEAVRQAASGLIVHLETVLRPRDRKPKRVHLEVACAEQSTSRTLCLQWVFTVRDPSTSSETAAAS
jgi:CheY-like chemotaxis protein